jgi:hypothetical protein
MPIPKLVLGFLLGAAVVTVLDFILTPHLKPLLKLLWTPEAAGWAQVVGTVGAILAAAWIAGWQQRKTSRLARESEIRRAKAAAGYIVPILKIIEFDVANLIRYSQALKNGASVRALKQLHYQFRPLPPIQFVLENADSLPGESNLGVPQLLSLRELTANNIDILLERHGPDGSFSNSEVSTILRWLEMMKSLLGDMYNDLRAVHDEPLKKLLDQSPL